jgi:hypothetical protein
MMKPHKCQWTVTFSVSDNWIADQFALTQECVDEMIQRRLPYAFPNEVTAEIKRAPDSIDIAEAIARYEKSLARSRR